jgi:hypothetical protein
MKELGTRSGTRFAALVEIPRAERITVSWFRDSGTLQTFAAATVRQFFLLFLRYP